MQVSKQRVLKSVVNVPENPVLGKFASNLRTTALQRFWFQTL